MSTGYERDAIQVSTGPDASRLSITTIMPHEGIVPDESLSTPQNAFSVYEVQDNVFSADPHRRSHSLRSTKSQTASSFVDTEDNCSPFESRDKDLKRSDSSTSTTPTSPETEMSNSSLLFEGQDALAKPRQSRSLSHHARPSDSVPPVIQGGTVANRPANSPFLNNNLHSSRDSSMSSLANRNKPLPVPEELQASEAITSGISRRGSTSPLPTFSISPVIDATFAVRSWGGDPNEITPVLASGDRSNSDASQRSSLKSKLSRSSQLFRRSTESKGSSDRTTPSSSPRQKGSVLASEDQPAPWYRRSATPSPNQSITDLPSSKTVTGSSSPARDSPLSRASSPLAFRGSSSWLGSSKLDYLQERHLKTTPPSPADASSLGLNGAAPSSRSSSTASNEKCERTTIMGPPDTSASSSNTSKSKAKGEGKSKGGDAPTPQPARPRLHRNRSRSMDVMEHFAGQLKKNIWEYGRPDAKADMSSIAVGTADVITAGGSVLGTADIKDNKGGAKEGTRGPERTRLSMLLGRRSFYGAEEAKQCAADKSGTVISNKEVASGREGPFARLRRQRSTTSTLPMTPMTEMPANAQLEDQRIVPANATTSTGQKGEQRKSLGKAATLDTNASRVIRSVYSGQDANASLQVAPREQVDGMNTEFFVGTLPLSSSPVEESDFIIPESARPELVAEIEGDRAFHPQKRLSESSGWDEEYTSALSSAFSSSDQLLQMDSGTLALSSASSTHAADTASHMTGSESDPNCHADDMPAGPRRGRSSSSISQVSALRALTKMTPSTPVQAQRVPNKLQPSSSEPRDMGLLPVEPKDRLRSHSPSRKVVRKSSPNQAAAPQNRSDARKPKLVVDIKAAAELDVSQGPPRPKSAFSASAERGAKGKGSRRPSQATLDIVDDLEFLQALEHVRSINKERIRKKEEESNRVAQMARMGMASSNKRSTRAQGEQSEHQRTRDRQSGPRRPSRAPLTRRSSSADARYTCYEKKVSSNRTTDGESTTEESATAGSSEKPSALEMGVGRASGKMRDGAFLNDDDWKREVKALFVIRELVLTERSYARHLETLLQAVRGQYLPNRKTTGNTSTATRYNGQMPPHFALMRNLLPQLIALSRSLANRIDENPTAAGVGDAFRTVSSQMEATFIAWSASAREILDALRLTEKPKSKSQFRLGLLTLAPTEGAETMLRAGAGFISVPSSPTLTSTKAIRLFPDGTMTPAATSHHQTLGSSTSTAVEDGDASSMPLQRSTKRRSTFSGLAPSLTPTKSSQSFGRRALEVVVPSAKTTTLPGQTKLVGDAAALNSLKGTALKRSSTAIKLTALSTPGSSTSTNASTKKPISVPASPPAHTQVVKKLSALDVAIMPTQRLPRYLLLLRDLNSSTPPQSLSHVRLQRCVDFVNEIASRCDRASQ